MPANFVDPTMVSGSSAASGFNPWWMLGGAALGALGGDQQGGTTTSVTDIPDWLKAYVEPSMADAYKVLQGYQSPGAVGAASPVMQATLRGDYLDPRTNPYLKESFEQGAGGIKGALSPSFGHMQAFGGNTGYQGAYGKALAGLATNIYGGNYQRERDRQTSAMLGAPGFDTGAAGAAFAPFSSFMDLTKGYGSKTSTPYYTNPFSQILGGAMAGAGMQRVFGK